MNIIQRISNRFRASSSGLTEPHPWLIDALGGTKTAAGIRVNEETALRFSAVFACIRVLSESVASLPLVLYRRREDGGKTVQRNTRRIGCCTMSRTRS